MIPLLPCSRPERHSVLQQLFEGSTFLVLFLHESLGR